MTFYSFIRIVTNGWLKITSMIRLGSGVKCVRKFTTSRVTGSTNALDRSNEYLTVRSDRGEPQKMSDVARGAGKLE